MEKQSFNLAVGYRYSPNYINRRLLIAIVGLVVLLTGLAWHGLDLRRSNRKLQTSLASQGFVHDEKADRPAAITKTQLDKQSARIAFANSVIQKDSFQWSELLERLEHTLTEGIALEQVQPDPKTGDISLVGRADSLDELRGYLQQLSRSQWFADTYLLEQERVEEKQSGEGPYLRFEIRVRKGF